MHPGLLFAAWLASTAVAVAVTSTAVDQVADHVGPDPGIVLLGRAPAGADAVLPVVSEPSRQAPGSSGPRAAGTSSGAAGRAGSGAAQPTGGAVPPPAPAQALSRAAAPGPRGAAAPPVQAPAPPQPRPTTAPPPERRQAPAARPSAPSAPSSVPTSSRRPSTAPPTSRPPTSSAPPAPPAPARVEARSCTGGRVEVRLDGGRLLLHRVVPAAGVAVEVDDRGPERVRVEFTRDDDGTECRVRAELVGGRVDWRVEEDR